MDGVFMYKFIKGILTLVIVLCLLFVGALILDKQYLSNEILRLHVVANSDSQEDQTIKLRVKDALLDYFCVIQAMEERSSGNGRLARNVIESAILAQSRRVLDQPDAALDLLEKCDFDLFE